MQLTLRRRTNTVVGLDIQGSSITAAEVPLGKREVKRVATAPLPPRLIKEGEFVDQDGLSEAIKGFFGQHGLSCSVRLGIASQRAVVRTLRVPLLQDRSEFDAAVRFKASESLPMPLEEAVIDYQVVNKLNEENSAEVVLAAAPREMVDRIVVVARKAGLKLIGIDLAQFALIRALADAASVTQTAVDPSSEPVVDGAARPVATGSSGAVDDSSHPTVAYCHLGSLTTLAVARGSTCLFSRTLPYGVDAMVERLAKRGELSLEDAYRRLTGTGSEESSGEGSAQQVEGDAGLVDLVREVLQQGAAELLNEIQTSLDYYTSQPQAQSIAHTLLTGPGTTIDGLVTAVGGKLPGASQVAAPQVDPKGSGPSEHFALAYGLALDGAAR